MSGHVKWERMRGLVTEIISIPEDSPDFAVWKRL